MSFHFANAHFTRTARLWIPYLAAASIVTINQFVAQFFATGLDDGSVSALTNAIMFLQIPIGIFTTSVATVTFPTMSRQVAQGQTEALRGTVAYGINFLLVLLVPSSILLSVMGREIIAATLQRGHFTSVNTLMAARTLTGYAIGLVSMGIYTFLQKLFNSYKTFVVPLASAALIAVIDIILSLVLKETPLRVSGLAYANSIAFTVGMLFLGYLARRRLGGIGIRSILLTLGKAAVGSVPMTALLVAFLRGSRTSGCTAGRSAPRLSWPPLCWPASALPSGCMSCSASPFLPILSGGGGRNEEARRRGPHGAFCDARCGS